MAEDNRSDSTVSDRSAADPFTAAGAFVAGLLIGWLLGRRSSPR